MRNLSRDFRTKFSAGRDRKMNCTSTAAAALLLTTPPSRNEIGRCFSIRFSLAQQVRDAANGRQGEILRAKRGLTRGDAPLSVASHAPRGGRPSGARRGFVRQSKLFREKKAVDADGHEDPLPESEREPQDIDTELARVLTQPNARLKPKLKPLATPGKCNCGREGGRGASSAR